MNCLRYLQKGQKFFCPFCFLFFALLFFSGCTLPEAPGNLSWLVHANIPLSARTYGLWDLADAKSEIRHNGSGVGMLTDSSLFFSAYTSFDEITLADSLYFESLFYTVERPILAIKIPINLNETDSLSLGRMNAEIAALHGTVQNLAPHPLQASIPILLGAEIDSFEVDSGKIELQITNALPYSISNLRVSVSTMGGERELLFMASVGSGEHIQQEIDLTIFQFRGTETLLVTATGEGGNGILVDSTNFIQIHSSIDALKASPYFGRIPAQVLNSDSLFELNQEHTLFFATIDSGLATITLDNFTQFDDTVAVIFPNVFDLNNDSLVIRKFLSAGEETDSTFNLAGYRVRLTDAIPQLIEARLRSVTIETADHRAFIEGTEIIQGTLNTERVYFSHFEGEVDHLQTDIPEQNIEVDTPPEGWDTVHPTDVELYFHIHQFISVYTDISLTLQSYFENSLIATVPILLNHVFLGNDTTVVVNNLAALIAEYPDRIHVKGRVTLNGPIAYDSDVPLNVEVELKAPLSFTLDETHPAGDVEKIETDNLQDIEGGSVRVRIWNRLPIGGEVFLVASTDSASVAQNSGADVDTLISATIPTSVLVNGRATEEAYSEFTVILTDSILNLFHQPFFYARPDLLISGSDSDTLVAHGSDYLRIQVIADILHEIEIGN